MFNELLPFIPQLARLPTRPAIIPRGHLVHPQLGQLPALCLPLTPLRHNQLLPLPPKLPHRYLTQTPSHQPPASFHPLELTRHPSIQHRPTQRLPVRYPPIHYLPIHQPSLHYPPIPLLPTHCPPTQLRFLPVLSTRSPPIQPLRPPVWTPALHLHLYHSLLLLLLLLRPLRAGQASMVSSRPKHKYLPSPQGKLSHSG
jgi:hypothetical protein